MTMQRPHVAIAPRARLGAPQTPAVDPEQRTDLWVELLLLAGFFSVAFLLGVCVALAS